MKSLSFILDAIKNNCKKFVIASTSSEYLNDGDSNKSQLTIKSKRVFSSTYSLSKIVFTDIIKMISQKINCNFRIMRIFPTYGEGEHKTRLYPIVKKHAKNNKDLFIKNPNEFRNLLLMLNMLQELFWRHVSLKKKKNLKYFIFLHVKL